MFFKIISIIMIFIIGTLSHFLYKLSGNNKVIGMLTIGDLSHYYDEIGEDYFCGTFEDICECGGQAKNNC